jgi:hypothetical protein
MRYAAEALSRAFKAACLSAHRDAMPVVLIPERNWPEFLIAAHREFDPITADDVVRVRDQSLSIRICGIRFECASDARMNGARALVPAEDNDEWREHAEMWAGQMGGEKHRPRVAA